MHMSDGHGFGWAWVGGGNVQCSMNWRQWGHLSSVKCVRMLHGQRSSHKCHRHRRVSSRPLGFLALVGRMASHCLLMEGGRVQSRLNRWELCKVIRARHGACAMWAACMRLPCSNRRIDSIGSMRDAPWSVIEPSYFRDMPQNPICDSSPPGCD